MSAIKDGNIKMKRISKRKLKSILKNHEKWLRTRYSDKVKGARADLSYTDLSYTDLRGVNLRSANLIGCNLCCANLIDANLSYADMENADFRGANLYEADLSPEEQIRFGIMVKENMKAYKKCYSYDENVECIVKLVIPKGSIIFSINNNRCRTNRARVSEIRSLDDTESFNEAYSSCDSNFKYKVGEEIEIQDFNCQYNKGCISGIHFFRTKQEAIEYEL